MVPLRMCFAIRMASHCATPHHVGSELLPGFPSDVHAGIGAWKVSIFSQNSVISPTRMVPRFWLI